METPELFLEGPRNPSSREGVEKGHGRQERCLLLGGGGKWGAPVNSSAGAALGQMAGVTGLGGKSVHSQGQPSLQSARTFPGPGP